MLQRANAIQSPNKKTADLALVPTSQAVDLVREVDQAVEVRVEAEMVLTILITQTKATMIAVVMKAILQEKRKIKRVNKMQSMRHPSGSQMVVSTMSCLF